MSVALHAGHEVRAEVEPLLALDERQRLREEDPYTDAWVAPGTTHVVATRSRFEVDLNRSRDDAVYLTEEHAWGLTVWQREPPPDLVARSRRIHDDFYAMLDDALSDTERRCGRFVVYDLHSYNHRRGAGGAPADPVANPDVNVGTGALDRHRWAPVVDRFLGDLRQAPFPGGPLDVRENVRFRGGHLSRWVSQRFPASGCVLAIEVKKFFMDERTGQLDAPVHRAVGEALASTVAGLIEELSRS